MNSGSELSYIHQVGSNPLIYRNLGEQFEIAVKKFPTTEAIVSLHENIRWTYTELRDRVDKLAAAFLKLGLKSGDVIAVWGPNTISWYLTMVAAARTGLTLLGLNPALQGQEVRQCLKKVDTKAIITPEFFKTQNYFKILKDILPEIEHSSPGQIKSNTIPTLRHIIVDSSTKLSSVWNFDELMNWADNKDIQNVRNNIHKINVDSPCNIQLTSGTTGEPKAVVLSHFNVVNNSISFGKRIPMEGLNLCCQVPFFHAYGLICALIAAYEYGSTLILPSASFDAELSLQAIHKEKCVVIYGTPTMYVDLVNKQKMSNKEMCSTAKYAVTAGAPCSPQLFEDIKSVLKLEKVNTLYGLSETTAGVFISIPNESRENVLHTVGRVLEHQEVKIVDDKGLLVPFGTPGELHLRGYRNMIGYYGDEEKTRNVISRDGWLRTGYDYFYFENFNSKIYLYL